jgi:alpha-tubulin suppressor-like RCC1 family protein
MSQTDLKTPFAIYGELYEFSVVMVACGETFSLCITDNGRLFSWGENKEGQLGVGDFKGRAHPTLLQKFCDPDQPRLKDMKNKYFDFIAVGNWHCLAITNKKKVYSWGKNKYGQLGLGNTKNQEVPHCVLPLCDPLNPKHVRSIAAGKSHSVAAGEDGDVFSWGRGWDGQLGHRLTSEVVYEPRLVEEMENKSTAILACGREHTVAVSTNGNLWVWGDNKAGQLGIGTIIQSNKPVPVSLLDEHEVKMAACGREHTVCVTATNEVYGFGSSIFDQLGLGHLGIFPRPQRIQGLTTIPSIRQLDCGFYSTAVVGGDDNAYLLGRWDGLTVGSYVESFASKYTNVKRSGKINAEKLSLPLGIQSVRSISLGKSHGIIVGMEDDKQGLIQQRIEREAQAELSARQTFVGAANAGKSSGRGKAKGGGEREPVQTWVQYNHGGEPFPAEVTAADMEKMPPIKQNVQNHIRDDGQNDALSFSNAASQYDDGLEIDDNQSVASRSRSEVGGSNYGSSQTEARKAKASEPRELAANMKGNIIAWGNNQHFQLGCTADPGANVDSNERRKPLSVPRNQVACPPTLLKFEALPSVTTVSCGEYHTIAVCQDGSLWTWGRNNMGQLGHGDCAEGKYKLPKQVMGLAKKICIRAAAGGQHSLVLTSSNKVYSWGCNLHGQLGLEKKVKNVPSPDIVTALRRSFTCHIACGYSHCVALLSSEQVFTWGRNDCGQLGLGHYAFVDIPEHVTFFSKYQVQQVSCGYDHCIAFVKETESTSNSEVLRELIFSWGRGEEGQLGHSDPYSRCVPKEIATLTARGILMVTAGGFSSVAIDEADQVYTWGDCARGQLGHGDKVRRTAPAIVMQPLLENQPKPDVRDTFRARAVVVGPSYMLGIVYNKKKEKEEKWSWGDNGRGQLAMPYCNLKKRKAESHKMKLAPEKIPFLTNYRFKEISCGLEHGMAVVDLQVEKHVIGEVKKKSERGAATIENLENDLEMLYVGEVEKEEDEKDEAKVATGKELADIDQEEDDEDDVENEDEDEEKLNYPRQIYDKVHPVRPIIKRIGLSDELSNLFEHEGIKLDSFVTLDEDDLLDMGIRTLGARLRILRSIEVLKAAEVVPEHEAETFVPDEYAQEVLRGIHPGPGESFYQDEDDQDVQDQPDDEYYPEEGAGERDGQAPGAFGLPIPGWPPQW